MNPETEGLPAKTANTPDAVWRPAWEWSGFVCLGAAIVWLLKISWRRWPDPLIDFGRELYLPWRLSEGAVLYRDVDANYGPFSHYFNALVFRVTGVGFMHLVWTNFVIYLAILALIYRGLRMGWGRLAAFAGSFAFVVVFSFSHLEGIGNYNFLSPYSHETTHGFLFILILIHLWASWLWKPCRWRVVAAGLCFGLCALLKVEVVFTAGVVTAAAIVRAFRATKDLRRFNAWLPIAVPFALAGLLPSLIATLALWVTGGFPFTTAFAWANIAWTGLFVFKNIASDPIQIQFLGLTDISGNLATIIIYGGLSVAWVCGLAAICGRIKPRRRADRHSVLLATGALLLLMGAFFASYWLPWLEWGVTFPAGLGLALFIALRNRAPVEPSTLVDDAGIRWMFLLAAGALLARMCLYPRVYHYGYYQAALAGMVTVATAFRSVPDLFRLRGNNRILYMAALGVFLAAGLSRLEERSDKVLSLKTQPVGEGVDQLYGYAVQADAAPFLLESARKRLAAESNCRSLLVIPEGVMLNYLLRKPVPVSAYNFNPYWLNWRDRILDGLQRNPPDDVVLISRDMREYGMKYFGDTPEHGKKILFWIDANYKKIWQAGGNPLDMNQRAVFILQRREGKPASNVP